MEKLITFNDLRSINVNEHVEKKGGLSYLSWAWAVDQLLQQDPMAKWEFKEPQMFGLTMMVWCEVSALGKKITMHLPVMDNRNNAISEPDARKVSDSMMRCLTKAIACFGIGLYIYAGEDLPQDDVLPTLLPNPSASTIRPVVTAPHVPYEEFTGSAPPIMPVQPKATVKPKTVLRKHPRNDEVVSAAQLAEWTPDEVKLYLKKKFNVDALADLTSDEVTDLLRTISLYKYIELE